MQPCTPSAHHATRYSLSCLTMLCTVAIVALISDMVGEGISPMAVPSACIVVPPSVAFVKLNPPKTSAFDWRCKERLQAVLSSHLVNTVCEVQVLRPYKDSHSFIPLHTVYCVSIVIKHADAGAGASQSFHFPHTKLPRTRARARAVRSRSQKHASKYFSIVHIDRPTMI